MAAREGLVPKRTTDKNGRETTVLVNPNKGAAKNTGTGGEGWATGSPARVSRRNRVESVPTPPSCKPTLGGLAALADEAPVLIHGHSHDTSHVPRDSRGKPTASPAASRSTWTYMPEPPKPPAALAGLEFTGTTIDDEHEVEWTDFGTNRETGTKYDHSERDQYGFDRAGFDRDGFHTSGFDIQGRDRKGRDQFGFLADGTHYGTKTKFDTDGFDVEGVHAETGTRLDPRGLSQRWYLDMSNSEADPRQFLPDGTHEVTRTNFDLSGFDREGFDVDGYNPAGKNRDGLTREQAAFAAENGIDADLVLALENGGDSE